MNKFKTIRKLTDAEKLLEKSEDLRTGSNLFCCCVGADEDHMCQREPVYEAFAPIDLENPFESAVDTVFICEQHKYHSLLVCNWGIELFTEGLGI